MYNDYLKAVGQFYNVFSPEECAHMTALPLAVADAEVQSRSSYSGRVDHEFRRTRERAVPPSPEYLWIYQRLGRLAGETNQKAYRFRLDDYMTVAVLDYDPEGFFDWHLDLGVGIFSARKLSMVTFLTPPEAYEGGELRFMDKGPPLRLAQGATVIFPSYLMHKVEPVTCGTRSTLVSWVHGPSFS